MRMIELWRTLAGTHFLGAEETRPIVVIWPKRFVKQVKEREVWYDRHGNSYVSGYLTVAPRPCKFNRDMHACHLKIVWHP